MLNGLDLFSGIGGISLALAPWVKPIAYCENDRYAQAVLLCGMGEGKLQCAPIWDDVRNLRGNFLPSIDIITGGFPCQDISTAGAGKGLGGERSGLVFEIFRLTAEIQPAFVFLENVPAIRTRGSARICYELASLGYDLRWCVVSAADVGAPHLRRRWFCLASNPNRLGVRKLRRWGSGALRESAAKFINDGKEKFVAHANNEAKSQQAGREEERVGISSSSDQLSNSMCKGLEGWLDTKSAWETLAISGGNSGAEWPPGIPKPTICRGDDGIQHRAHRIKGLGNSVVPQQARYAFEKLMGMHDLMDF